MHLIARKSSEQRCSLFQGQIQYYHKHFLLYVFQVNDYRHSTQYHWDSRERRQKKRYTLREEFHLANILRNPKIG